jgi:hypothetical protein
MQFLGVHPGLTHRLLVATARGHHQGTLPCDWTDLAEQADITASPRAINRALSHLAEDGLIEGVYTSSGWMHLQATARGVRRAGRAARKPPKQRPASAAFVLDTEPVAEEAPADAPITPAFDESESAQTVGENPRAAGEAIRLAGARLSTAISLRVLALRAQLVQVWNVFKTQP